MPTESLLDLAQLAPKLKRGPDGIWYAAESGEVSYPDAGNDECFEVEDRSFWFQHRNACIKILVSLFPPHNSGPIFDIGGGNGFVAQGLMNDGWGVVLVEPGPSGARHAKTRGLENVVCATTQGAGIKMGSLPAIGVFDVVEHIENDTAFLRHLHDLLVPGGMLYLTVPAHDYLWSQEDLRAGHFRRYTKKSIRRACADAGFRIRFVSGLFLWLVLPILAQRALPFRLASIWRRSQAVQGAPADMKSDHSMPAWLQPIVAVFHRHELRQLSRSRSLPTGSSLVVVAEKI